MSFANLEVDGLDTVEKDVLGKRVLLDTDVYDATIKMAYVSKSASSNAHAINVILDVDEKELREQIWYTNRDNKPFYVNKSNEKQSLPGYNLVNALCAVTTGQPLKEQQTEEKTVKIYDKEAQQEIPQPVQALTALIDKPVKVAILKKLVNKKEKQNGQYVPITETIEINEVNKFFHAETGKTFSELTEKFETAEFINKWLDKNKGKVIDKTDKNAKPSTKSTASGTSTTQSAAKPASSLFD